MAIIDISSKTVLRNSRPLPGMVITGSVMQRVTFLSAKRPVKELIASFNTEVERREYPGGELNNRRVGTVEEAIKAIEAAKDHPPLRSTTSASKR